MLRAGCPQAHRFSLIALDEPSEGAGAAQRGGAPARVRRDLRPRRAIIPSKPSPISRPASVASWKEIPGAQPPVGGEDSGIADRIVRADPRWRDAMRARGIRDANAVYTVAWPAGYFDLPGEAEQRIVRVTPYFAGAGANYYAHPVEGVAAHVNLTTGKVLDFLDIDRNAPVHARQ